MRWLRLSLPPLAAAGVLLSPPAAFADETARLERMVIQDCGSCHGLTMKGGLGRPLTPKALDGIDATTIAAIILDGIPGTAMPPWRPLLTEQQAMWVAQYLKDGTP